MDAKILQILIGRLFERRFKERGEISSGNAEVCAESGNAHGLMEICLHIGYGGIDDRGRNLFFGFVDAQARRTVFQDFERHGKRGERIGGGKLRLFLAKKSQFVQQRTDIRFLKIEYGVIFRKTALFE